jgi:formylglycine-generating enzyme required for sulfatase activity
MEILCSKVYSIKRGYIVNGSNRIIRGGSWNNNANNLQVGNVNNNNPDNRNNNNGFRPASTGACMGIPVFTDTGTE